MPPELRRVTLSDGTPFWCLRPSEVRLIEDSVRDYFRHGISVDDGDIVFDVGANIGLFAHAVRQLGRQDVSVFSFEPIPAVFAALEENARQCEERRWVALPCALGRAVGTATFRYHFRASMISTAYPDTSREERRRWRETVLANLDRYPWTVRWLRWLPAALRTRLVDAGIRKALRGRAVTCPVRTVSDVLREYALPRIDLLKVDVERGELDVLAGIDADDWPRIRQVAVEVHDLDRGRVGGIAALLRKHGFDVVTDQEEILRATDIFNVYAIRRQKCSSASATTRSTGSRAIAPAGRPGGSGR
jgi:FkbM family methyltransferase